MLERMKSVVKEFKGAVAEVVFGFIVLRIVLRGGLMCVVLRCRRRGDDG